jgi:hypothetical protein
MAKKILPSRFYKADFSGRVSDIKKEKRISWYIENQYGSVEEGNFDVVTEIKYRNAKKSRSIARHYVKKGNINKVTLIKVVMRGEWQFFFPKVIKS